jgi:ATP-dependent DNA helicase RecG
MTASDDITELFRLNGFQKQALKKLGIQTAENLLYHFPTRYIDTAKFKNIAALTAGETAVIFGKISELKTGKGFRTKIPMASGLIEDPTGRIKVIWFNQPYLAKIIANGTSIRLEGKVSRRKKTGELYFSNPKVERVEKLPTVADYSLFAKNDNPAGEPATADDQGKHGLYPVYPESRGVTSNWFYHTVQKLFLAGILEKMTDPIPPEILEKYHLPSIKTALIWIHTPKSEDNATSARKRFAFEEVFLIQIEKQLEKRQWQKSPAFPINQADECIRKFLVRFPFPLTGSQQKSINHILTDFKKDYPMSRLLEGDVGSGKTAVAAATAYAVVTTKPSTGLNQESVRSKQSFGALQVAYMAPTEILARQHFESFIQNFSHLPVNIGLITGSGCRKFPSKINPAGWTDISRAQLLKWVANGEIPIVIGTHALIQKTVRFKHLAYVIIDEQHRFGLNQRKALVRGTRAEPTRNKAELSPHDSALLPHFLSMTATPIPRTLALTIFGDLDLSLLDEMPAGRKPIITEVVPPNERPLVYEKIRRELAAGRQAYVICPRIDEPDPTKELAVQAKSVKEEAERLKKSVFPEYEIGIVHSKLKNAEKEKVMDAFKAGKIQILAATSVVEVGVNVPNATIIVIEGAERFGLAQLHQLRGRVIRSNHQAYCYVFTETNSVKSIGRLKALGQAKNGFELAEFDLKSRGAGELSGTRQWGVSDIAMEALKNIKMVEAARVEAAAIIQKDPGLKNYSGIRQKLDKRSGEQIHFE